MKAPPFPHNEAERIKVLHDLLILDTVPEMRFDAITTYCQSRFKTEIVLVSLVDTDRQWFKSACGLTATQTPRDISFCGHTILHDEVMVVKDARKDERFHDNPLVLGPPFIRFYAGAPLTLSSGHRVGTLCLIDQKPRQLEEEELDHLRVLAHMVSMELEHIGRIESCEGHCPYHVLAQNCPHKNSQHELPANSGKE